MNMDFHILFISLLFFGLPGFTSLLLRYWQDRRALGVLWFHNPNEKKRCIHNKMIVLSPPKESLALRGIYHV